MASVTLNGTVYSNVQDVLAAVASGKLQPEVAGAMIPSFNPPRQQGKLSLKVSEKGALSVYGLQRMPVTLYSEQWERLLAFSDDIRKFLVANAAQFSHK